MTTTTPTTSIETVARTLLAVQPLGQITTDELGAIRVNLGMRVSELHSALEKIRTSELK
jgi:hypothetical protein